MRFVEIVLSGRAGGVYQEPLTEAGIEMSLQRNSFWGLFCSFFEVFARLDDNRCLTAPNLDVVRPSESRPSTTINDFLDFCFYHFSTTKHNA